MSASEIIAVTAGTNPVTGTDQFVVDFADGDRQVHEGPWAEARELAYRARLDHREDGPVGVTRWSRR